MTVRSTFAQVSFASLLLLTAACGEASSVETSTTASPAAGTTEAPTTTTTSSTTAPEVKAPAISATTADGFDFSGVTPVVQNFVDEKGLNGASLVVVHADHGVIHNQQWGEFTEDRISLVASSSKMVTAGVLLRLQDDGLLDIDAPVSEVAPWGSGNPEITPAQLISNSSGLVGLADLTYAPYLCQWDFNANMQDCAEQVFTTPEDDSRITPPDSEFNYGGAQWQVAGAVAEVASGKSWNELINEIYVEPCGLEATGFNSHFGQITSAGFSYPTAFNSDPSQLVATENPNMEGGMYTTSGDYAKLLLMHLRQGKCGDNQVLSPESLNRMHSDRIDEAYDGDAWEPSTGYGMGWWVDRESGRITDGGAYGSHPWLDLGDGYGAFLLIEATSEFGNELASQLYDLVEAGANQK